MMGEKWGKYWRMWGSEAWRLRDGGEEGCWDTQRGGAASFFEVSFRTEALALMREESARAKLRVPYVCLNSALPYIQPCDTGACYTSSCHDHRIGSRDGVAWAAYVISALPRSAASTHDVAHVSACVIAGDARGRALRRQLVRGCSGRAGCAVDASPVQRGRAGSSGVRRYHLCLLQAALAHALESSIRARAVHAPCPRTRHPYAPPPLSVPLYHAVLHAGPHPLNRHTLPHSVLSRWASRAHTRPRHTPAYSPRANSPQ